MEERKTIGERLLERIESRSQIREPLGHSRIFEDRYARYAREQRVGRLAMSIFPSYSDTNLWDGSSGFETSDSPTYLDGAPFWARMRRLGNARLRREQRLTALGNRFGRHSVRALTRRWPGESRGVSPRWGSPIGRSIDDLRYLVPDGGAVEGEQPSLEGHVAKAPSVSAWSGAAVSSSPWLTGRPFKPAKVKRGRDRKDRPLDRVGQRFCTNCS
jgi:hypothetical protein